MPSKKKTEEPKQEKRPDNVIQLADMAWPTVTEVRDLTCKLSPQELTEKSEDMARLQKTLDRTEAAKKASAAQYKAEIDRIRSELSQCADIIADKAVHKDVKCEWKYEEAGIDAATGKPNYHPEKKTLYRTDTNEPIEIRGIDHHERQTQMTLGEAHPPPQSPEEQDDRPPEPDAGIEGDVNDMRVPV